MTDPVSFDGVLQARGRVYRLVEQTPLHYYPELSALLGASVYVKHENHHAIGSFKVRGGINLLSTLNADERARGVICATRGNHGQSIAYAAKELGVRATVVVPLGNNPDKNSAIQHWGGELIEYGRDFEEAKAKASALSQERGYRYIRSGNEPKLIEGVATYALEIHDALPEPDFIFVPIGLGSGISGNCIVAEGLQSKVELIGCQAQNAPAVGRSVLSRSIIRTSTSNTIADGLATREPEELPLEIMRRRVRDVEFLAEEDLLEAMRMFLRYTHNLAEGAAAASLAAAVKWRDRIAGKSAVIVLTGSNVLSESLRDVFFSEAK